MKLLDTIAAVSTPRGKGGVAMIRISGQDAIQIGEKIFKPKSKNPLSELPHGNEVYGEIRMPDDSANSIDDGMAVCFFAPHSFTGENTVEITCHGGILVTQKVLSAALCAGARMAEAGEFTRRAFVNGKLKLSQAEALGNLLEAKTDNQLRLARNGMRGALAQKTGAIYDRLCSVLTSVYAAIDFPDEDLSELSREQIIGLLSDAQSEIRALAATYRTGQAVSEGIPTVICGRANAGKSSVYNRILGYDAAIVTDIEGTTRDILRETAVLGNTTLLLCDTAGLRHTDDRVEAIGIERTQREIENAGLILAVFDISEPLSDEDLLFAEKISQTDIPAIALLNKSDRPAAADTAKLNAYFPYTAWISAKSGEGFEHLSQLIDQLFLDGNLDLENDAIVTGARQYATLTGAERALEEALISLRDGLPLDLCSVEIEDALKLLGEVDGRELGEEIVAEIFSKFCVGK